MTTKTSGERVRLAVYVVSLLLHGGLWQGVRSLEPPPPPPPPPIKITMREAPVEKPPEPEPEPEAPAPEPEAPPVAAAPTPVPPPPTPAPSKPKKPKPAAPEPAAEPPSSAPPEFGVQMAGGTGPGGRSVPSGDPGGSATPPARERVEAKARKLEGKAKPAADACGEPEVRPTPLEIPQPPYSDAARAAGVEGKVRVQLAIADDGSVASVKVVAPLHPDLDEAARVAMKSAKFTPATRCGKPVATTLTIGVKFTL